MNDIADLFTSTNDSGSSQPFMLGTVSENSNDKYPARVKVEFTSWQSGKSITDWLPVLQSYAGDGYGQYILPEIGDCVLIGFIGNKMEKPFIMGSFFPQNSAFVKNNYENQNINKAIKTKDGVLIKMSNEKEKQALKVTTPKELTVVLEDANETIKISDKAENNKIILDSKNGTITLEAQNAIVLKAGDCEIQLNAQKSSITVSCAGYELKASQSAAFNSNGTLKIDAASTSVQGKEVAVKANAMCEVTGGMLKLN